MNIFRVFTFIKTWLLCVYLGTTASISVADDIDLYVTGTQSTLGINEATNSNLLFVMDTSGSMGTTLAVRFEDAPYNSLLDYGDSDDDNIYVYRTSDMKYINRIVRRSQNNCKVMQDSLADPANQDFPVYLGRTYQWQTQESQVCDLAPKNGTVKGGKGDNERRKLDPETEEVTDPNCFEEDTSKCGTVTIENKTTFPLFVDNQDNEKPLSVTPGKGFTMDLFATGNAGVFFEVRAYQAGGTSSKRMCSAWVKASSNNNIGTQCAALEIPNGYDRIQLFATISKASNVWWSELFIDTDIVSLYPNTEVQGCVAGTTITRAEPKWIANIYTENTESAKDSKHKIECEADGDLNPAHGANSQDGLYPQNCAKNQNCNQDTAANYTNKKQSGWNKVTQRYYVSANYHDYLQASGTPTPTASGVWNPSWYCSNFASPNDIISDVNGDLHVCTTRLAVMQSALKNVTNSLKNAPVNLGLMQFNNCDRFNWRGDCIDTEGGTVIQAVKNRSADLTPFVKSIDGLVANGYTPLSESLYETYRYFAGKSIDMGKTAVNSQHGLNDLTASNAKSGSQYISPIQNTCQENYVVLLTDGEPVGDYSRNNTISSLTGKYCGKNKSWQSGECLDDIAQYMANTDLKTDVNGINRVKTFTIGFQEDFELLEKTAQVGGGKYFTANSSIELTNAFQQIALEILSESSTFVAPAVSVNAFNELNHRNELYYALFQPNVTPQWSGNIKKYRLKNQQIVDINDNPAVDISSGYFAKSAQSYWSSAVDGDKVTQGGAAENLSLPRNLYAELDGSITKLTGSIISNFSKPNLLNVQDNNTAKDVLNWMLGQDVYDQDADGSTTDVSNFIADPLHNRPRVITFGGDSENPKDVLFYSTNLGTFHAIDPADTSGEELWAYWPSEHLKNPSIYLTDTNQSSHQYGLDGESTFVIEESEGSTSRNFSVSSVKAFFGERRGGSTFYALDVSNARMDVDSDGKRASNYATPFKVMWKIKGVNTFGSTTPSNSSGADTGFEDLAQSWSKPLAQTVKIGGTKKEVIVFSGGYDPVHDNPIYEPSATANSEFGNAIYVVDRETGELLFSIGNNDDQRNARSHRANVDMRHAIPSTPTVFDTDGDGGFDIIYSVDIAGNVWRIDIDGEKSLTSSDFIKAGKIASLSEISEGRKFYNGLSVSRSSQDNGLSYYNLVVGSGYRANPMLEESELNRLYVLFDDYRGKRVLEADEESTRYSYYEYGDGESPQYRKVKPSDLVPTSFDSPAYRLTVRSDVTEDTPIRYINGFYLDFDPGEKVLQRVTTTQSKLLFSSFLPTATAGSIASCGGGSLGSSRVYALDLETGLSIFRKGDGEVVEYLETNRPGIPVTPTILITEDTQERQEDDDSDFANTGRTCTDDTCTERVSTICSGTECNIGEGQFEYTAVYRSTDEETEDGDEIFADTQKEEGNDLNDAFYRDHNTVYRTYWIDKSE